jgi:predicted RNA polymerase sigma factor
MKRAAAEIERLRDLLRLVADEPNIDKGRALADAELHGPNVEVSR